jgi:hypothetical protein
MPLSIISSIDQNHLIYTREGLILNFSYLGPMYYTTPYVMLLMGGNWALEIVAGNKSMTYRPYQSGAHG